MDFLKGAKDFARNPLGIIALFISLIYGFVSLLLNASAEKLTVAERWPLLIFIVVFPVLVLIAFYKLVTKHHGKLYAPADFKDDKSFLRTLSPEEQEQKLENEVNESLGFIKDSELEVSNPDLPDLFDASNIKDIENSISEINNKIDNKIDEHKKLIDELRYIEKTVIDMFSKEYKTLPVHQVGIQGLDVVFDAFLPSDTVEATFLEIKVLRRPSSSKKMLDSLLYQAVLADRFFDSKFKLILVVVYYFDESNLHIVKDLYSKKIGLCPVDIELRFISSESLKMH